MFFGATVVLVLTSFYSSTDICLMQNGLYKLVVEHTFAVQQMEKIWIDTLRGRRRLENKGQKMKIAVFLALFVILMRTETIGGEMWVFHIQFFLLRLALFHGLRLLFFVPWPHKIVLWNESVVIKPNENERENAIHEKSIQLKHRGFIKHVSRLLFFTKLCESDFLSFSYIFFHF